MTAGTRLGGAALAACVVLAASTGAGAQTFGIADGVVTLRILTPMNEFQEIERHNRQLGEVNGFHPIRVNLPAGPPALIDCNVGPLGIGAVGAPRQALLADGAEFSGSASFFGDERGDDQVTIGGETFLQFAVRTFDDDIVEQNEIFNVSCTSHGLPNVDAHITILDDDTSEMAIAPSGPNPSRQVANEEDGTIDFTVTLTNPVTTEVTARWTVESDPEGGFPATVADEFSETTGTVTFAALETTQTISIPIIQDDIGESPEDFIVRLSEVGGPTQPGAIAHRDGAVSLSETESTAKGRIRASDTTLSIADASAPEGEMVVFTVTRSGPGNVEIMVDYATSVGSGDTASVADFTATSGTLTIPARQPGVTTTIAVPTIPDEEISERSETFTITLSNPRPASVLLRNADTSSSPGDTATATGTILEANAAPNPLAVEDRQAFAGEPFAYMFDPVTDPNGDTVTYTYMVVQVEPSDLNDDWLAFDADTRTFSGTPTIDDVGEITVRVTATDDRDPPASADADFTITVDPSSPATRATRLSDAILPHVAAAMAESAVSALAGRIASAASGAPSSRLSGLAGKPDFLDALTSGGAASGDGTFDLERALGGSSFVLSANATGGDRRAGDFAVWGSGDWRNLSGPDDSAVDWDGDLSGFHLGADVRLRPDLLAGVAVSRLSGSFGYTDRTDPEPVHGNYDTAMTGVHPYASWSPSRGPALWAMAGWSEGEIEIAERGGDRHRSDTAMWTAAVGASQELASDDRLIAGGTAKLRLKGEGSATRVEIEGGGDVQPAEYDVQRLRVALEGAYECLATRVGCLAPSLEAGLRHDGGDATTGLGVEVAGGLRWTDHASGLTVEGRGRALVADADDREDWGFGGLIRLDPGSDGRGLSFSLTPGFGDAASKVERLYGDDLPGTADAAPSGRVETEIGYGFGDGPLVVVTPYSGAALGEAGSRSWRAGVRLEAGPWLGFGVEGTRRERGGAAPDHGVTARGRLRW